MLQPNRTALQIINRLRADGFTVTIPDTPYRRIYQLRLSRGWYFGTLDVSADKGRALRISMTWQPNRTNRKGSGASRIIGLLNTLPQHGWNN
ncbi:hypothetical protein HII36_05190 [Nonomuraea sp. NN258]|uniref:hypothetical protein n=1 Tax=Nonomuraea antri TaxID=2730852 RepID=UPI00156A5493|nr:hypothetical protein [Nonomuraea antri]NRQ31231.1 hypothetical protein [Nonomuraea antri]